MVYRLNKRRKCITVYITKFYFIALLFAHHVWKDVEQHIINIAVDQWRRRLTACVGAKADMLNTACE